MELETLYCVYDNEGVFFVSKETIEQGLAAGWYVPKGFYRDAKNRLVMTYSHYVGYSSRLP